VSERGSADVIMRDLPGTQATPPRRWPVGGSIVDLAAVRRLMQVNLCRTPPAGH